MAQPDILLFMSDQHAPQYMQGAEINVDTPNLKRLEQEGTAFREAYTPCPLCVPARMAMLSGLRPAKTGIFTNNNTLADTTPTFLHELVAAGYETVLIGRMHFVGRDQRHGFTKRIAPDMTPVTWTRPVEKLRQERGVFSRTFAGPWAPQVVGGGESPVLHYDEMITESAIAYLREKHDKPQFILVGSYGPHFPYVAPPELFEKYWNRVETPAMHGKIMPYMNPCLMKQRVETTEEVARGTRAAYCGMIERMDEQIGAVRDAFDNFVAERGTKAVFGYLSDHGDQAGERSLYGKETFFEKSAKVPLILAGDGIAAGNEVTAPVSLLDVGPTICALAGAEQPHRVDGISLMPALAGEAMPADRTVFSEYMEKNPEGEWIYSQMLRQGDLKFITYHTYESQDMLFNVEADPLEMNNLAAEAEETQWFRAAAKAMTPDPGALEEKQREHVHTAMLMSAYEKATVLDEAERWQGNPPTARTNPEICIAGL